MGRTACTEPQCLYKCALYLTFTYLPHCVVSYHEDIMYLLLALYCGTELFWYDIYFPTA